MPWINKINRHDKKKVENKRRPVVATLGATRFDTFSPESVCNFIVLIEFTLIGYSILQSCKKNYNNVFRHYLPKTTVKPNSSVKYLILPGQSQIKAKLTIFSPPVIWVLHKLALVDTRRICRRSVFCQGDTEASISLDSFEVPHTRIVIDRRCHYQSCHFSFF